jgi:hypothetical protein
MSLILKKTVSLRQKRKNHIKQKHWDMARISDKRGQLAKLNKLRSYAFVFSRQVFSDILNYSDFSSISKVCKDYQDTAYEGLPYSEYLQYMYKELKKNYRNEYVYKNEIINDLLKKKYSLKNTVAFNEFRVQDSIADLALFNGETKAFEIKTELDTPKRLEKQLHSYQHIFDKCYIVVPDKLVPKYSDITEDNIGIIQLTYNRGHIKLDEIRKAQKNTKFDTDVMMMSLRTQEYKDIVMTYYGSLPSVSCFDMYSVCKEMVKHIPQNEISLLFREVIKRRKNNTSLLSNMPVEIRQLALAMNFTSKQAKIIIDNIQQIITI